MAAKQSKSGDSPGAPEKEREKNSGPQLTAKQTADEPPAKQSVESAGAAAPPASDQPEAENGGALALDKRIAELEDKLLRALADKDNAIKRMQREILQTAQRAVLDTAGRMFDVADNLERAIEAQDSNPTAVFEGVALTLAQLRTILSGLGIEIINPSPGERHNPNLHQTIMAEESGEHSSGTVLRVVQRGYQAGNRVLRAASVVVAKACPAVSEAQKTSSDSGKSEAKPAKK